MADLYDYLDWRGDLSFSETPLNEVDALILAWLSYAQWNDAVPAPGCGEPILLRDAARAFLAGAPVIGEDDAYSITATASGAVVARQAAQTRRFGELKICGFVNEVVPEEQKQFCAVTLLGEGFAYAAYRGTDSTLVGWRENCNLSLSEAVPAQRRAAEYLSQVPELKGKRLYIGGHSKGGNLAVYAAVMCPEPLRGMIDTVWDFDGPGFLHSFLEKPEFLSIRPRIKKYIPRDSIVGMLLESGTEPAVISSAQSGLFQHNGVLWEVMGSRFVRQEGLSAPIRIFDQELEDGLNRMDEGQRVQFINALFRMLDAAGVESVDDIGVEEVGAMIRALAGMEEEPRRMLQGALGGLVKTGNKMLYNVLVSPSLELLDKGQRTLRELLSNVTRLWGADGDEPENGGKLPGREDR